MITVITYGTFDLFHKGHYNILKRAKEAGDYLIVGVTGENYDEERGKLSVNDSLAVRIENVKKTGFVDKVIVEEYLGQKIHDILKYNVDIFVIGSDWKGKFDHLSKYCEVRYLERTKDISSTRLREQMRIYRYGIVTDDMNDNGNVREPKHVSGVHVQSVYCEDADIAAQFCSRYELNQGFSDYQAFLDSVDIVYVKSKYEKRSDLVEKALQRGKHVICEPPCSLNKRVMEKLYTLSEENNVAFIENITPLYLQAFEQLIWMTRGNMIGAPLHVRLSINSGTFSDNTDLMDTAYYSICAVIKLLGCEIAENAVKIIQDTSGKTVFALLTINYASQTAIIELGNVSGIDNGMKIIGTEGCIEVPANWWQVGYFKMLMARTGDLKRYSFNYEGNGFRYLVCSLMYYIRSERPFAPRVTREENDVILRIISSLQ